MEQKGRWPLPKDLAQLHDVVIEYAVRIQAALAAKQEKTAEGPVSHVALQSIHRTAIVTHRSIRSLCEAGWTPVTPTLIRTLLDLLASCYAIVSKYEDAEYMAFKFMCSYLIQSIKDPDTLDELRKNNQEQLDKMRKQMKGSDLTRVEEFIAKYKSPPYWFNPEFASPGKVFRDAIPRLFLMYRQFSGSTHGSFIGSLLFSDSPDAPSINPEEHPIRMRSAIIASSRLLLDVSWGRGHFDGIADLDEYKFIVSTFVVPQKDKL
ncbi:MAG TPA: DUF5677 domain-containing protein [Candidatus Acidoferrales bacterium]|jgi:hypothetical protein|nr:DUF5677 domain-containing protein [Candidatus Acidoferrales bacterium]